ncbi:hypothetical protein [Vibrio mediterranei]|uniref:RipA family octameric membrane protein n=1 Tax=Vibrio mediterranei TaxID=689 RepID=UPI00228486D2|nr:hypothetical protein [Vibrio mediterranei]MCY9856137.1 hypothetical protein [Vibrio mediterranei]
MGDKNKYNRKFKIKAVDPDSAHAEAFRLAIDTRKFEIDMYWKRATYFWTFIAATFAGYGVVKRSPSEATAFLEFSLACFGFILSFAWYFVNRGSKQWQENWEHHVDRLENKVTGPLYKTVLRRAKPQGALQWIDFILTGPSRHSVSKINQLISLYITIMWGILVYDSQDSWRIFKWPGIEQIILLATLLACFGVFFGARTYAGDHGHTLHERSSTIVDQND